MVEVLGGMNKVKNIKGRTKATVLVGVAMTKASQEVKEEKKKNQRRTIRAQDLEARKWDHQRRRRKKCCPQAGVL